MKEQKKEKRPTRAMYLSEEMENVASMQEATGMIPVPPQSDEEAENYASLYDLPSEEHIKNK